MTGQSDTADSRNGATPSGGLSGLFIRRPIATVMLMAGVLILGLIAYAQLPIGALPNVNTPTLQVTAQLPGADAATNASAVTTPLERQFGQIAGLNQMTSSSALSFSQIALQFDPSMSLDHAAGQVQAAINAAAGDLPPTLTSPPVFRAVNPAQTPVLILGLTSDDLPLTTVDDYAESILLQRLSQVPGVGLVTIGGQQQPAMRVDIDPDRLAAHGLTLEDVRAALQRGTVDAAKGALRGQRQMYGLATNDQITAQPDYQNLVIAYRDGAPVRISDVGTAAIGPADTQLAGWFNHRRAIILNILPAPGANVIQTVDRIKAELPALEAALPPSVKVAVVSDRTTTIRASVRDVEFTLMLTVLLVVGTIFLFLREVRATIIPGLAVPLSIIGAFAVMRLCSFSLDNLSLMALSIAVGFVVDDAVVMIENIVRHLEEGLSPMQAALKGAGEIGFTIISISIALIAVFIPLLMMHGVVGRMFQEFAVTVVIAIVLSALISISLTPTLCAKLLKPHAGASHGRAYRTLERGFQAITDRYDRALRLVLRHQGVTLGVMIAAIALTGVLYAVIPKGFFPEQDTGLIAGITESAQDISTDGLAERQTELTDIILRDPAVASVASYIGPGPSSPAPNQGRMFIALKPEGHRGPNGGAQAVIARLDGAVRGVAGIRLHLQAAQDITIGARVSKSQYQYTLVDANPAELNLWAGRVVAGLKQIPGLTDVASDQSQGAPQLDIQINRDLASRLGVAPQDVDNALYDAFGERPAAKVFTSLNQYEVILEVAPAFRADPQALDKVYLKTAAGTLTPLSSVASVTDQSAPLVVNHQAGFPSVTVSFDLAPHVSIGAAVDAIHKVQSQLHMPLTVQTSFQGAAQAFQTALSGQLVLILAALVAVYLILGVLYESWIHPITILSTFPSAGLGALLTLEAVGMPLDVIGLIGIVLLIGIVNKNGIMMVDFAITRQREGLAPEQAVHDACVTRFRPILMTTLCAVLGGVPLMLGSGAGAEIRQPLGYAIVGGLMVSQLLTLFTTPVVYLAMDRLRQRLSRPRPGARPAAAHAPTPATGDLA
ncbi:MAG: efflux RND transporter permease subunit [Caulobacteraceae bacterium]|nr:efflux RND transporter permease subunit [Caulobacteraceae bacterium]